MRLHKVSSSWFINIIDWWLHGNTNVKKKILFDSLKYTRCYVCRLLYIHTCNFAQLLLKDSHNNRRLFPQTTINVVYINRNSHYSGSSCFIVIQGNKECNKQPSNCIHYIVKILPEAIVPHTCQFTDRWSTSGFIGNWNSRLSHCVETNHRTNKWKNVFGKETLRILCGVKKNFMTAHI
jgi:hypothetical protein